MSFQFLNPRLVSVDFRQSVRPPLRAPSSPQDVTDIERKTTSPLPVVDWCQAWEALNDFHGLYADGHNAFE